MADAVAPIDVRCGGAQDATLPLVSAPARDYEQLWSSSQANETEPQAWHRHVGFIEAGVLGGIDEGGIDEIFF